jgi:hypothetical protein
MLAMLLTSLLASAEAPPQTLAEAAAKAREARHAPPPVVVELTDREVDEGRPWEITLAGFRQYASIRSDLKALRRHRPTLNTRLYDASRNAEHLVDLAPAIASEPFVVDVLERYHVTPHEYLWMEQSFLTADYWARQDTPRRLRRQLIHVANIRFIREKARLVRELIPYWGDQWHEAERFVERF